jgi:hypothetical protein
VLGQTSGRAQKRARVQEEEDSFQRLVAAHKRRLILGDA